MDEPRVFADYLHVGAGRCGLGTRDALRAPPTGSVSEQVGAIAKAVEDLRGLEQTEEIEPEFVNRAELERRLRDLIEREMTDDDIDRFQRVGDLLAAFPPGFDVSKVVDALATETLGFYDPDAKEIFIERAARRSLDEFDISIVAHELEHALADDALGLSEGDPRDD